MIFEAQLADPTPEREQQVIRDCVEQAVLAEEMGFDRIWAVEHHSLLRYAHISAPEVFLSFVAARTSRIRIGHGVVCLPFNYNHPIRVGERAAMLDILSDGRVDLGVGRGATVQEMSAFGVDPDRTYEELDESLRMVAHMWDDDMFEWHGPRLDVEPHPIVPRPVQWPHPPLYLACSRRDTVTLAANYGIGALVLGFAGAEEIAFMRALYDDATANRTGEQFVSSVVNDHFSALCPAIVLDDEREALRIGTRGQRFFAESIGHWYGAGPPPSEDEDHDIDAILASMREQRPRRRDAPRGRDPGDARVHGNVERRARVRRRQAGDRLRGAAARGRRRRGDVPRPDGDGAPGRVPRDHPPAGRARAAALPEAGEPRGARRCLTRVP